MNTRPHGALQSDTKVNPRREGHEQCKAVTLRSGKQMLKGVVGSKQTEEIDGKADKKENLNEDLEAKKQGKIEIKIEGVKLNSYVPPMPFPQRLQKVKANKQFSKFLEVFKKLQINIPFADALEQMPSYVKFMKEILSRKRKLEDFKTVALTKECSAILQKKLPPKL